MQLIADAMLGRLARWLRALGHDVVSDPNLDDSGLAELAVREDRRLLTRDRRLCMDRGNPDWCLLVREQRPRQQVQEVDDRLGLFTGDWRSHLFSRCMVCNTPLRSAHPSDVRTRLPPAVRDDDSLSEELLECDGCDRVFWEGSHTRRMRAWLEAAAAAAGSRTAESRSVGEK